MVEDFSNEFIKQQRQREHASQITLKVRGHLLAYLTRSWLV
jgi:hypothetical protein